MLTLQHTQLRCDPERADNLFRALQRLAPSWGANEFINVACTKVDLANGNQWGTLACGRNTGAGPGHV
jgi:hypothetical protein